MDEGQFKSISRKHRFTVKQATETRTNSLFITIHSTQCLSSTIKMWSSWLSKISILMLLINGSLKQHPRIRYCTEKELRNHASWYFLMWHTGAKTFFTSVSELVKSGQMIHTSCEAWSPTKVKKGRTIVSKSLLSSGNTIICDVANVARGWAYSVITV